MAARLLHTACVTDPGREGRRHDAKNRSAIHLLDQVAGGAGHVLKIATWNMGHRRGAWDYLERVIDPDYAIVQETLRPRGPDERWYWTAIGATSSKYGEAADYRWGS